MGFGKEDERWMRLALAEAQKGKRRGEIPIGAALVRGGKIWARGHSQTFSKNDPTAHAEISVLRRASQKARSPRFMDAICYTTLEPCPMCATALVMARVKRVVFGAKNPRMGAVGSVFRFHRNSHLNHAFEVKGGVLKKECEALLNGFFKAARAQIPYRAKAGRPSAERAQEKRLSRSDGATARPGARRARRRSVRHSSSFMKPPQQAEARR